MKKIIVASFVAICAFFAGHDAAAQGYRTGIGVRLGTNSGLTVKHFTSPKVALEGIVSTQDKNLGVTGLIEAHAPIGTTNLNFVYGAGGHVYFYNNSSNVAGVDGILGLDYKVPSLPINLTLDWKPAYNFGSSAVFLGNQGGLSIRYAF